MPKKARRPADALRSCTKSGCGVLNAVKWTAGVQTFETILGAFRWRVFADFQGVKNPRGVGSILYRLGSRKPATLADLARRFSGPALAADSHCNRSLISRSGYSFLIQDEPGIGTGFSHKMSLEGGIGMLGIDHQHGRFGRDELTTLAVAGPTLSAQWTSRDGVHSRCAW